MYAVILAGGSGTRLWPLSREQFPKQYLPLIPSREVSSSIQPPTSNLQSRGEGRGGGEGDSKFISLFQATIERVSAGIPAERIIIVTHTDQAIEIRRQLAQLGISGLRLLEEPEARNTAPAIGLAAQYLLNEAGPEQIMAVLPSDHLIPDHGEFVSLLADGAAAAAAYGLVTFGIRPTYPETGYGYICCGEKLGGKAYKVDKFVEKPDLETAEKYLTDSRYLWNSGMFVFQVGTLLEEYEQHLPATSEALGKIDFNHPASLNEQYRSVDKTSIDYGILEKAASVTVIPTTIKWNDLGSWEAYHQVSARDANNNYLQGNIIAVDTEESLIISQARLTGAIGVKNLVVIDTADALLVCDRSRTQDVKEIANRLKEAGAVEAREHRTVYRPWGSYTSLELGENFQVKRINVNSGARLSLQSHKHRAENWVVVKGEALVTINDDQLVVKKGESAYIPRGARHRMENRGQEEMILIEVQYGDYLGEDDIERFEDDYGRTDTTTLSPSRREGQDGSEAFSNLQSPTSNLQSGSGGKVSPEALAHYNRWLSQPNLDPQMKEELLSMQDDPALIENHFGQELIFGTGGMRGIIGPGLNRINCYTIRRATQGLADFINGLQQSASDLPVQRRQVAIAYDTRLYSAEFAEAAALVLAANGIKALLFDSIRPTPLLSYATRALGCAAGIVITASHNPPQYNGYKVYGPDGGQAVSPLVDDLITAIKPVDIFTGVNTIAKEEAINRGLFELIDPAYDQTYLKAVKALSLSNPAQCLKVVFTPLHGTGSVFVPDLLKQTRCVDLHLVEKQMEPDPNFNTVRVPNPEDPAALTMALELADQVGSDLILATDPDCDRVGTAIRDQGGELKILSGNQMGAVLIEYICSRHRERGTMPADPVLVKTIVTGDLGRRVAESYGLKVVETLTGFKFIGEQMKHFEEKGVPHFIFGYEESCGYLTGTFVRDKDAVIASFLIAEMTAYYKERGLNLLQVLEQIQQRVGYHRDELMTVELTDISEADRHVEAYHHLPREFAGRKVTEKRDYEQSRGWKLETGEEFALTLPRSPVLHYTLDDGSWFAVRPSGTEPKVKIYLSVNAPIAAEAENKLTRLRKAVLEKR